MRAEERSWIQNSVIRAVISLLSLILQIWWICFIAMRLRGYSAVIGTLTNAAALIIAVILFNKNATPNEFKTPLIMLILAFPIVGLCMFLMIERKGTSRKMKARFSGIHNNKGRYIRQDEEVLQKLEDKDPGIANQFRYLSYREGFPVYTNTDITFYPDSLAEYREIINTVKKAKKFIFIEYHAIEDQIAFHQLKSELIRKARAGVEVRVLYDDIGSIGFLNSSFQKQLTSLGIDCRVFNRISPAFRIFMNNRDHRKITIIDGKWAFTGGFNLADEYFNYTHPYGHWKDSGVAISGAAVNSMTEMFLAMWNSFDEEPEDFTPYYCEDDYTMHEMGYIQPYADNPLDNSYVGENAYLNMIKNAKRTLYLTTPYLIPGDVMKRELTCAAERGVDVRIVTPGIPDKKLIYRVTRSCYKELVTHGVRIYEYTPGFLHSKQMIADDEIAIVGTINMDYRSFYHHFENAVMLYWTDALDDISLDFFDLFTVSNEVTEEYRGKRKNYLRLLDSLLRLAAPLF